MNKFKNVLMIITCLLLALNIVACTSSTSLSFKASLSGNTLLSPDKIQADANQLVSIVESTHPAFSLNALPAGYADAKNTFLSSASREMSVDDFTWLTRAYLSSLQDGHTSISFSSSIQCLDVKWLADGNKLYLLDDSGKLSGRQVTEIGGVSVAQIFQTVGQIFAAENDAGRDANDTLFSVCEAVLVKAGVSNNTDHVTLTLQEADQTTKQDFAFIQKDPYDVYNSADIVSSKIIGDVFYIDLNKCQTGTELDSTITKLKNTVATGVKKVIIDIRDNPGGDSESCIALLEAMGMKVPDYGVYIRFSTLAAQSGYSQKSGSSSSLPKPGAAKPNSRIELAVLTNENSFSSATMLGVFVQDGKLGTVIGRASGNSPSGYGNPAQFQLNNSCIKGSVSFKRWLRPDTKADPKTLQPDVPVPMGGDILQAALNYLNK